MERRNVIGNGRIFEAVKLSNCVGDVSKAAFNSRSTKARAMKKSKAALPKSSSKRAAVIADLIKSPAT